MHICGHMQTVQDRVYFEAWQRVLSHPFGDESWSLITFWLGAEFYPGGWEKLRKPHLNPSPDTLGLTSPLNQYLSFFYYKVCSLAGESDREKETGIYPPRGRTVLHSLLYSPLRIWGMYTHVPGVIFKVPGRGSNCGVGYEGTVRPL